MKYALTDYQGNELAIPEDKAALIAAEANLIEIEVNGQTHYLNPKNIASIMPMRGQTEADVYDRPQLMEPEPKLGKGYENYQKKRDELFNKDI